MMCTYFRPSLSAYLNSFTWIIDLINRTDDKKAIDLRMYGPWRRV